MKPRAPRRQIPRWLAAAAGLAALLGIAGCSPSLETDQARLCRMALPALAEPDARLTIVRQQESADGRGVQVDYLARDPGGADAAHFAQCRFRAPGRPLRSAELVDVEIDGVHLSEVKRYFLIRFWLATPEARAADPAPLGDIASLPILPPEAAYLLQQAINGLPLTAVYALLAAAYSLVYGLVGRINLAFGELAAAGGYAAALGAGLFAGGAPAVLLSLALMSAVFVAATWGMAASRWVFQPLHRATGQIVLVASIGLALFLQEFLRLTQGSRQQWVSPILNAPFGVARSGDFIVTTAPNALLAAALALAAGGSLISLMALSRFGRNWRAYADDPLGAQMLGVDPERDFRPDLRAGERIRRPRRLRHDDVLRRGRLRLWDDARPEGAGRGDSRRHRLDPGRVSRRPSHRRLRGDLVERLPDRLSRRRDLQPARDPADAAAGRNPGRAGERGTLVAASGDGGAVAPRRVALPSKTR